MYVADIHQNIPTIPASRLHELLKWEKKL
jgi:hypothetical protein